MNYAKYRKQIEKLYKDWATISRHIKVKKPSGETKLDWHVVHSDIPCRLSQKALGAGHQTEAVNEIIYETKLFTQPDIEIMPGDTILVNRFGSLSEYTAGEPFVYGSHQEVSLLRKGQA